MEVKNQNDGKKGAFYLEDEGKRIGEMDYSFAGPGKMIIIHTEVKEAYGGKGLGLQLVTAGVAYAREQHLKILPLCPFAKKVFDRTPELADVLF